MKNKLSWKHWVLLAVLLLAAAGGVAWWLSDRAPEVSYRTGTLEQGPLQSTVSASGTVNPVTQVSVGTQVSGQIQDLFVDFNSEVRAGQLIAQIDPETFQYRVRQAQADVEAAQAAVLTAQANGTAARAAVSRAQVDLAEARRDLDRKRMLVAREFIAKSEAERAEALVNTSTEALKSAQAQAGVADAQVKSAQANVAQRQAALAQARVDLARTRIVSPVNGIVIKRAVEKGQTVAASLQAPELFVIAQNLQDMQVDASVDESDIGRIRPGQRATFTVDAFPGQSFEGEIRQVRKAAQNVSNVVTYVAVVGFSNTGGRLLPGMTANVRVITDARESVLKVPNAALRVRIAGIEPPAPAASAVSATASRAGSGAASSASGSAPAASSSAPAAAAAPAGSAPGGRAGPGSEFRNRLVTELQLTSEQIEKVDAVYAEARPRFMQLRELSPEERPKARERITAEIRARIGDLLTPEQKPRYAALLAEAAGRTITRGRVYVMGEDGQPRALSVRLGITDGTSTELLVAPDAPEAQVLKAGARVVTGVVTPPAAPSGPRLPF
jgi:HlyD family secretion protein